MLTLHLQQVRLNNLEHVVCIPIERPQCALRYASEARKQLLLPLALARRRRTCRFRTTSGSSVIAADLEERRLFSPDAARDARCAAADLPAVEWGREVHEAGGGGRHHSLACCCSSVIVTRVIDRGIVFVVQT